MCILLNERSKIERAMYYMIPIIRRPGKTKLWRQYKDPRKECDEQEYEGLLGQ